jgi:hypothetical protein
MDGANLWMPGCGFPRLIGRTHSSLFFLFDNLVAFIINRCGVRSTIIPEQLAGKLGFLLLFLFYLSQGSFYISFVERLQIRPVFVPDNFVGRRLNSEIFELETLEANCNLNNFFHPRGSIKFVVSR